MDRSVLLGEGNIGALLYRFSLPAVIGMLVNASYNVVDRVFIGRVMGAPGLAGLTVGFPILLVIMAFGMLFGMGAGALISIRLGESRKDEAERIVGQGFFLLVLSSVCISILGLIFLEPLLGIFGASREVMPYAKDYCFIILLGTPLSAIAFGGNFYIRAEGNPYVAMGTMIICAAMNAIFAIIFIFGFKWGMMGAGLGTVLSQGVASVWVLYYFTYGKSHLKLKAINLRPVKQLMIRISTFGSAPCVMQLAASLVVIIMNQSLLHYGGDKAISAVGIANSITMMILMPVFGVNQGAQPIIGYNFGAKNFDRVKETLKKAIYVATAIVSLGFLAAMIIPHQLIMLFNSQDQELIDLGVMVLRNTMLAFPIVGFQVVSSSYFLAVGKPKSSMVLTLSRQVLFLIPAVVILPKYFGLIGVFYASPVSDFLASLVTAGWILREMKHLAVRHEKQGELEAEAA